MNLSRRNAIGALIGLPVALSSRARGQSGQMDVRVIEGVISAGAGIFNALKAGISPLALNTNEMLGLHCGLIEQLRHFGGVDDYLNLYVASAPPPVNPDEIYSYLVPHYGPNPLIQAQLRDTFAGLPYGTPGMYQALFAAGGHDPFNNLVAGAYQYYKDQQGGYSQASRRASMQKPPRVGAAVDDEDPECVLYPEICYPPPPIDPCAVDPVACYPPWGPIPGVAFPWADRNDPKTPKPVHGMTRADVCFYATKATWYFGQIAAIYNAIIKRDGILVTLSGEIIIATPVGAEVIGAVAIGLIVVAAIGQITC